VSADYQLRSSIEDLLAPHEYEVSGARNATEALASCRNAPPALVLCDVDAKDGFGVRLENEEGPPLLPKWEAALVNARS
jgi:DNA-binding NtrC family response regulator